MKPRLEYNKVASGAYEAMLQLQKYVDNSGLERSQMELVKMRASQINGCVNCLDMRSKDARPLGETE